MLPSLPKKDSARSIVTIWSYFLTLRNTSSGSAHQPGSNSQTFVLAPHSRSISALCEFRSPLPSRSSDSIGIRYFVLHSACMPRFDRLGIAWLLRTSLVGTRCFRLNNWSLVEPWQLQLSRLLFYPTSETLSLWRGDISWSSWTDLTSNSRHHQVPTRYRYTWYIYVPWSMQNWKHEPE